MALPSAPCSGPFKWLQHISAQSIHMNYVIASKDASCTTWIRSAMQFRRKYWHPVPNVIHKYKLVPRIRYIQFEVSWPSGFLEHYANKPIQIYWKFYHQKKRKFSHKKSDIFHIYAQNIDCGYSLEPPRHPQSMFLSRNKKNNNYPCKPVLLYKSGV